MNVMFTDWRARWGQGNSPFYYVQLAPYEYPDTTSGRISKRESHGKGIEEIGIRLLGHNVIGLYPIPPEQLNKYYLS